MFIKQLYINNFRNIEHISLKLNPKYNILYGRNAQGKTNTLEAISLLLRGKSHRINTNSALIRKNAENAYIKAEVDRNVDIGLFVALEIKEKRRFTLDNEFLKSRSSLLRNFSVILFTPEDLRLVKDGPSLRRDFLDESINVLYPAYYDLLKNYNKVLKEKNSLLKEYRVNTNDPLLDVYDESLKEFGCKIIKYRISVLKQIEKETNILYGKLAKNEEINFIYSSNIVKQAEDIKNIGWVYESALKDSRRLDIEKKSTQVGIHVDDIKILINKETAKEFASQGQQRSISLCMKLSLISLIKEKTGDTPIVLLDDVMSELDTFRQKQLINLLKDTQSFITCVSYDFADDNFLKENAFLYEVENGSIKRLYEEG